jgi:hypothetical protein
MLLRNLLALISTPGLLSVPSKLAMPSKFSSRIPWREKLTRQQEAKIVAIPPRMQARFGKGKMVIPKPLDVDALIRRVPRGKMATVLQLREELARRSKVDVACPLCTGIFVRISAEAAEEERRAGKKSATPYWRVISSEGRLNPKFPGGVADQSACWPVKGPRYFEQPARKRRRSLTSKALWSDSSLQIENFNIQLTL